MASPLRSIRAHGPSVARLLLLLYLPGCMTWHTGTPTPQAFIAREQPKVVRVTKVDGTTLLLYRPGVVGDSVVGGFRPERGPVDSARLIRLGTAEIQGVATRRLHVGRTVLLGVGIMVAAGALAASEDWGWSDSTLGAATP